MTEHDALAATLAELASDLSEAGSFAETLQAIVHLAVAEIHACDHAGVSLVRRDRIITAAASDDIVRELDGDQHETQQGPCVDSIREQGTFHTGDLAAETRWPDFVARATGRGVASIAAFRLYAQEDELGALNLFARRKDAFDERALVLGTLFATHAAIALKAAKTQGELERGLETRTVIGQAMGIIMATNRVSEAEAFDVLRRQSQSENVKLAHIARELVEHQRN